MNDWYCKCGNRNFSFRSKCRDCNAPKIGNSTSTNQGPTVKPGDWACQCGCNNFRTRDSCFKCRKPKTGEIKQVVKEEGDWDCNKCGNFNFKKRDLCFSCNSVKPNIETTDDSVMCVVCLEKPKTMAVVKCGHLCFCDVCGYAMDKCPLCREGYKPNKHLLKIFV